VSYPLSVFGAVAHWVFTWVLPVAFIAWVPAAVILDRTEGLGVSGTMAWLAPAVRHRAGGRGALLRAGVPGVAAAAAVVREHRELTWTPSCRRVGEI